MRIAAMVFFEGFFAAEAAPTGLGTYAGSAGRHCASAAILFSAPEDGLKKSSFPRRRAPQHLDSRLRGSDGVGLLSVSLMPPDGIRATGPLSVRADE